MCSQGTFRAVHPSNQLHDRWDQGENVRPYRNEELPSGFSTQEGWEDQLDGLDPPRYPPPDEVGDWSANPRYEYALADAVGQERWAQYVRRYYGVKPPKWMPHKKSGFSNDMNYDPHADPEEMFW
jgi:hypothetical protein